MGYDRLIRQGKKHEPFPGSSIASRYRALILTHRSLEEKLADETKRPLPHSATVQRIKKRKLAIKEEIVALELLFGAMKTSIESALTAADGGAPSERRAPKHHNAASQVVPVVLDNQSQAAVV